MKARDFLIYILFPFFLFSQVKTIPPDNNLFLIERNLFRRE